jgi:hypothetical protein
MTGPVMGEPGTRRGACRSTAMTYRSRRDGSSQPVHAPAVQRLPAPGQMTLTQMLPVIPARPIQRHADHKAEDAQAVHDAAARGVATPAASLPHLDTIQRAFGRHDVSGIHAHAGPDAAASARDMGARAYATGSHVVLGDGSDLHTVAHEAAHVVQQRAGVQLKSGVGEVGDDHERHADEVADAVVQGKSAEALLDRYAGGDAGQAPPAAAAGSSGGPIQRYVEFTHPTEGRMQMSESHEFFKPAASDRELWAKRENIEIAASIMSLNKGGILTVAPGPSREFLSQTYHRVVVQDRVGTTRALQSGASSSSSSSQQRPSPLQQGADGPFDVLIKWLADHDGATLGQLMTASMKLMNPYAIGTYANGAFNAIRIQQDLEINRRMEEQGADTEAPIAELIRFLSDWRGRIEDVNSEEAHSFDFMCTECGGFSKMVMPGKDQTQAGAEVGDRMRVNGLGDLPGPWQNHYAAVIMTDPRGDRVSLESAAGMDKWWFGMYGNRSLDQTFIVKTLLAKLDIGDTRGEAGSADAAAYVRARLAGDDAAATALEPALGPLKTKLDELMAEALRTS